MEVTRQYQRGYMVGCSLAFASRRTVSRVRDDWLELLGVATELIEMNEGVPLAPEAAYPRASDPGVAVVVTDASGTDGVGGYVFFADAPGEVWVVCESWPEHAAAARAAADATGAARLMEVPRLSMPAAELFGSWAVVSAAARAAQLRVSAIIAVSDCLPAVCAINRAAGGRVPQMRLLVAAARSLAPSWLGVHVPRELNEDTDTLSHPDGAAVICRKAEAAGLAARVAHMNGDEWAALESASEAGVGKGDVLEAGPHMAEAKRRRRTA